MALHGLIRARRAGGIDPLDGVSEKAWRQRLASRFAAELEAKPAYAMMRIIGLDDDGRELVRVDRAGSNETVRIVPEENLLQRNDRSYFQEATRLGPSQIYVSPLDLGRRNGQIEEIHRPTLRIAAPIFAEDGKPFGIFMINVDMRRAFDRARSSVGRGENIYVVNKQGDYLIHPDRSQEFGWLLGKKTDWKADFPHLAPLAGAAQGSAEIVPDQSARSGGMALAPALLAGAEWVGVIETAPNAAIMAPAASIRNTSLLVGLIAVLCAAALAVLIARSLTRPIVQLTEAVQGAARNGKVAIPVEARGETGVLARAFAQAIEEVNAKTLALEREVQEHRRTEAARDHHAERERLFSAAVELSNDAIITMSLDGTITGWNSAAERLFGYSAAEAVGENVTLLVPDDRRPEIQDALRRIGWGESIEHNETVRLRKGGSPMEVSLSISPIKSPSGATIGISKVVRDISDANKTRQVLRQQAEELRRIFETSQDLIMVMDSPGTLVQVSPSCETVLGYRPEEMIGRSAVDFIHPDHLETSRQEMRAARRGLHPKFSDTRGIHKDGHAVWLSWLGTWSDPVKRFFFVGRDMTGEPAGAADAARERAAGARHHRDRARRLRPDRRARHVRDWNTQAEKLLGWSRDEAFGRNAFDLIGRPDGRGPLKRALRALPFSRDLPVRQPRRELRSGGGTGRRSRSNSPSPRCERCDGIVFNEFLRDLTDRIAAEDRIRHADKMDAIGQLTGGIAHDFNNILTVITSTIDILAARREGQPVLATIARMIDDAAERGGELTQRLLAFARKQPLQPCGTDVNSMVMDAARLLRPALGEQVGDRRRCSPTTRRRRWSTPRSSTTALINLAINARDAMPNGGRLLLETSNARPPAEAGADDRVRPSTTS